jgi:hypothetical protein
MNSKRSTGTHIMKWSENKDKEKTLRAGREKQLIRLEELLTLTADFWPETMKRRRQWNDIVTVVGENLQPSIIYLTKLPFDT